MFHKIPQNVLNRMSYLEKLDSEDRVNGTTTLERLRQIPKETGKFIALLATTAPHGKYIEIGTSAGYSTMWLAIACREIGRKITTFEILKEKVKLAKETFTLTNNTDIITLIEGDARELLDDYKNISFCFLDAEKDVYEECYDKIIPNLVKGGILIADNANSHRNYLENLLEKAFSDKRIDAMIVPIGTGELICRKL
ncbi:MAG: O-methyltransferase [archaeon]|nr:O-methyltransferase [archaeon]